MPRRVNDVEAHTLNFEPFPIADTHRHDIGFCLLTHNGNARRAIAQSAEAADVVRMEMRIDRLNQAQV